MQIAVIFLVSAIIFGFGYMFGLMTVKNDTKPQVNKENAIRVDKEKLPIWAIVRYKHNGTYDCVWSSGHTKRDADKKCKQLNSDYHKNYGKYVVEDGFYED